MIGAGPGGISAAIQLTKERIPFRIFEKKRPGGLLWYANRVENLPGMPGKSGKEICGLMVDHAAGMGVVIEMKAVTGIVIEDDGLSVETNEGSFTASNVILAAGSVPFDPGIPGSLRVVEDYHPMHGRKLLIVGGGDLAFDNALRADSAGADVTILHRSGPKANKGLVEEVEERSVRLMRGDPSGIVFEMGGYRLRDEFFDHLVSFIGRSPDRSLLPPDLQVEIDFPSHSTSVKGLYLIGDAATVECSQAAYAIASGLSAAMHISRRSGKDGSGP